LLKRILVFETGHFRFTSVHQVLKLLLLLSIILLVVVATSFLYLALLLRNKLFIKLFSF